LFFTRKKSKSSKKNLTKKYIETFFKKTIDKSKKAWYNLSRYPKTAGSGKSASFPAEEKF